MRKGHGAPQPDADGGPARHIPVLLAPVLRALAPKPGEIFVDGTFGAGGYSRALLEAGAEVIGIDRDPSAIADGASLVMAHPGRLTLLEGRFSELDEIVAGAGLAGIDGFVIDIGVSSMQLDQAMRGFSFRFDGPLDMRMEGRGLSAADLVNELPEAALADVIYHYGEERASRAVARAILAARKDGRIETTKQLADIVSKVVRSKPGDIHPATRTFQALRIAVNDELGELAAALMAAERVLKPGGRLAVVSFHSLEDRIAKNFLAERCRAGASGSRHDPQAVAGMPTFRLIEKKAVSADVAESAINPRARSAKLRAAERLATPARSDNPVAGLLPQFPEIARLGR